MALHPVFPFLKYWLKFRGYQPRPFSWKGFREWVTQFKPEQQRMLLKVLDRVVFLSEKDVRHALVQQNEALLKRLSESGVSPDKVIYVSIDDAGSSSGVMLNLLRDAFNLERRGCHLVDSKNVLEIHKLTNALEEGAIVYVDDFSGSGNQFCTSRDFVAKHIVGNFSEFFLVACLCEEATYQIAPRGIEWCTRVIHQKAERPLHPNGYILSKDIKDKLRVLCLEIDKKGGLGYRGLATNVVIYRNCPNTMPVLFRGTVGQEKLIGIFPRYDDLPVAGVTA